MAKNSKFQKTTDKCTFGKMTHLQYGECLYSESRSLPFITLIFSSLGLKEPEAKEKKHFHALKNKMHSIYETTLWSLLIFCFEE